MEIQDFLKVGDSQFQEENQKILELCKDPEFLVFLVETLSNSEVLGNHILLTKVLIVFSHFCKLNCSAFYEGLTNDQLKEQIIQLLFAIPQDLRSYIQHSFAIAAAADPEQFCDVINTILDLINESMPLSDIQTILLLTLEFISQTTIIGPVAEAIHGMIGPLIAAAGQAVASDPAAYAILGASASIIRVLMQKNLFHIDETLTDAISTFIEGCAVESEDANVLMMKENILDLFVSLIKNVYQGTYHEEGDEDDSEEESAEPQSPQSPQQPAATAAGQSHEEEVNEEMQKKAEILELFNSSVTGEILEGALQVTRSKQNDKIIDLLITLLYEMVLYDICPETVVTEEFFTNFIIPSAHMSSIDFSDYSNNPNVYIETSFTDENDFFMSARNSASRFTYIVAKRYLEHYNPIELLAQIGEDKNDAEARIFLLCAYASAPGVEIDPDLFEGIFNLLTTEIPQPLVSTILRFVSIVQPKDDPATSSAVATHFILNSEDLVVGHAGVMLLNQCLSVLDDKVEDLNGLLETPYEELFPKIQELSSQLGLSLEADVMTKLFRVGGPAVVAAAEGIIDQMFGMWHESASSNSEDKDENQEIKYIDSIISIIDSIAPETGAIEGLQEKIFSTLQENITQFPQSSSLTSELTLAAYIALKLPSTTEPLIHFIEFIIAHMNEGNAGIDFDDSIVLLIGAAILHQGNPLLGNGEFIQALGNTISAVLVQKPEGEQDDSSERSSDEISNAFILAALAVKLGVHDFIPFINNALSIIHSMNEKDLLKEERTKITWSAFYLFASSFLVAPEDTMQLFTPEAAQMVIEHFTKDLGNLSHRELKMGFIALTFFAKFNVPNAFDVAGNISGMLLDTDEFEEERKSQPLQIHQIQEFYDYRQLTAYVPALPFPIDDFNEMEFYQEVCESMPL